MSGILHLYFTILIDPNYMVPSKTKDENVFDALKTNKSTNENLDGMKKAWRWLADVLNMSPRPNITAEMLAIFLKCCGYRLQLTYGKQFHKIIQICSQDFFELIKLIPNDKQSAASVGRLKNVFDQYNSNNRKFQEWKRVN
jgi:hypothetical protein